MNKDSDAYINKAIEIETLRRYYEQDKVIISLHAQERLRQRGIRQKDLRSCI